MDLEQWLMQHLLRLLPVALGLACAWSGVQLMKVACRSRGRPKPDNFTLRRFAFYFGAIGAGVAWGELFGYDRSALWVGLATGFLAPMAWGLIMAWLRRRFPELYEALQVADVSRETAESPDETWWGRRR